MEAETKGNAVPGALARQGSSAAPLRILFGFGEVIALTGLSKHTLRHWISKRWVVPVCRSRGGRGHEHCFSAWQTIGLTILANAQHAARDRNSYVGSSAVIRAMEVLTGLSDELLLSPQDQDVYVEERAAAIASSALPAGDAELAQETCERLAQVVAEIDRKARTQRQRNRSRLR